MRKAPLVLAVFAAAALSATVPVRAQETSCTPRLFTAAEKKPLASDGALIERLELMLLAQQAVEPFDTLLVGETNHDDIDISRLIAHPGFAAMLKRLGIKLAALENPVGRKQNAEINAVLQNLFDDHTPFADMSQTSTLCERWLHTQSLMNHLIKSRVLPAYMDPRLPGNGFAGFFLFLRHVPDSIGNDRETFAMVETARNGHKAAIIYGAGHFCAVQSQWQNSFRTLYGRRAVTVNIYGTIRGPDEPPLFPASTCTRPPDMIVDMKANHVYAVEPR